MDARNQNHRWDVAWTQIEHPRFKAVIFVLLCAFPMCGSLICRWWLPLVYAVASMWTYYLYKSDKEISINNSDKDNERRKTPRIKEYDLHVMEALGGWPGALLAQERFRHKTIKVPYRRCFWLIVLLHQAFWICWLFPSCRFCSPLVQMLESLNTPIG